MKSFNKLTALSGLTGLLAMGTGCITTQNHNLGGISKVDRGSAKALRTGIESVRENNYAIREEMTNGLSNASSMANNPIVSYTQGSQNLLSYSESRALANTYSGILPKLSANLYLLTNSIVIDDGKTNIAYGFDNRAVNFTGPLNNYLDEVKVVEKFVTPERPGYAFLDIGKADGDFASARAAGNQFSEEKGILGVEYMSNNPTNKFFAYLGNEDASGDVNVVFNFGTDDFNGRFVRNFAPDVGVAGLNAATVYSVLRGTINNNAGLAGVAGYGAAEFLDLVVGYAEGRKAPGETMMVQGKHIMNVGLEEKVARTVGVFERAQQLGAKDIIVFENEGGIGIVYANDVGKMAVQGNSLTVGIDRQGEINWKAFVLGVAQGAAATGAASAVYNPTTLKKEVIRTQGSGGRSGEGPSVTNPGQGNIGSGGRIGGGISVIGN